MSYLPATFAVQDKGIDAAFPVLHSTASSDKQSEAGRTSKL